MTTPRRAQRGRQGEAGVEASVIAATKQPERNMRSTCLMPVKPAAVHAMARAKVSERGSKARRVMA